MMRGLEPSRRALLLAVLVGPALVAPRWAWAQAADADAPAAPIAALLDGLRKVMAAGNSMPFQQRYDALAPIVERAINIPQILQTSVGLRWRELPPEKQAQLLDVFRRYTIAQYVANFQSSEDKLALLPGLRSAGADQIVQTELIDPSGEHTKIDYVMAPADGGWKAIDVLLDGSISRVAVQRSDFRSLVATGDGSALIDSLQQKTAQLAGGALKAG
jgi:phospholipid transport system substrate-binding protein